MSELQALREDPFLGEQFDDMTQQRAAATLGMWVFLATEVLFFGGLFLAYAVYRGAYGEAFAKAGEETDVIFGTVNTAVLLTSSLTMALAVRAARLGSESRRTGYLALTALLGTAFLVIKAFEYRQDIHAGFVPGTGYNGVGPEVGTRRMFVFLYYAMTGLHALHLTIGVALVSWLAHRSARRAYSARFYNPFDIAALYWHFIDLVWVFLYPMFYLIHRYR